MISVHLFSQLFLFGTQRYAWIPWMLLPLWSFATAHINKTLWSSLVTSRQHLSFHHPSQQNGQIEIGVGILHEAGAWHFCMACHCLELPRSKHALRTEQFNSITSRKRHNHTVGSMGHMLQFTRESITIMCGKYTRKQCFHMYFENVIGMQQPTLRESPQASITRQKSSKPSSLSVTNSRSLQKSSFYKVSILKAHK